MKNYLKTSSIVLMLLAAVSIQSNCSKSPGGNTDPIVTPPVATNPDVAFWVTKADQSILLQQQTNVLALGTPSSSTQTITLDSTQVFQTVDGFGYTLTGGSASLINT